MAKKKKKTQEIPIETNKDDFSGFSTSRNSPDLFVPDSPASAYMRDDGVGACGGARLGNGAPAGRVSGGCSVQVPQYGRSSDDVDVERVDVSDAEKDTDPDPSTPESMAKLEDKVISDSLRDNGGTDVEIEDESADDSSESDAAESVEEKCRILNFTNITAITLNVKESASMEEKVLACRSAGLYGIVTLNGKLVDLNAIYGPANEAGTSEPPKSQLADVSKPEVKVSAKASAAEPSSKAATGPEKSTRAATGPVGERAENSREKSDVNVTANAGFNPMHSQSPVVNAIKSWASIVKTNRSPDDEVFELSSEEGELEDDDTLPLEDEDCREEDIEKRRLVGVFSSKFPGKAAVQKMVDSWPRYCDYHYHRSGWIVFCFKSENDAMEVLQSGPYRPYGMPFTLKRMPKYFNFSKEDHSIVPIWIQLPNLPLRFWTKKALSKICSHVGTPLHTDKMTASINVPNFARCLVDVDLSKPRREFLNIRPPKGGKKYKQHILYENAPPYCSNCKRLGHIASACKGVDSYVTPLYVPKKPKVATDPVGANDGKKKKNNKKPSNASKTAAAVSGKNSAAVSGKESVHAETGSATDSGAAVVVHNPETVGTGSGAHSGIKSATVSGNAGQTSGNVEVRAGTTLTSGAVSGSVAGTVSGSDVAQAGYKTPDKGVVKTGLMTPGTYDDPTGPPNGNKAKGASPNKQNNKKRNGKNKKRKDHG